MRTQTFTTIFNGKAPITYNLKQNTMSDMMESLYGKDTAGIYESISAELKEIDEKYKDLKDEFDNPVKPSSLYFYTIEPVKLSWTGTLSKEIQREIIAVFDKYLPRTPK